MNPFADTKLWPHDNNEVYALYDKIFNSKGHGWSNLQSTHLNLPFHGDDEFAKLHAACRLILPLLPALCASSPLLDCKLSGMLDTRLHYYKTNQATIPIITGMIIPENIYSYDEYKNHVYLPIGKAIAPHDPETILDPVWVNSRGAMARFDRGSIEIRVMDIQECPGADMAIVSTVIEILQLIVDEKLMPLDQQMKMDTESLASIFDQAAVTGFATQVDDFRYLKFFGIKTTVSIKEIWIKLLEKIPATTSYQKSNREIINTIISKGSLSDRIISALENDVSEQRIKKIYHQLSVCLAENKLFTSNHV
jgi:carboxylate-amine ligase